MARAGGGGGGIEPPIGLGEALIRWVHSSVAVASRRRLFVKSFQVVLHRIPDK